MEESIAAVKAYVASSFEFGRPKDEMPKELLAEYFAHVSEFVDNESLEKLNEDAKQRCTFLRVGQIKSHPLRGLKYVQGDEFGPEQATVAFHHQDYDKKAVRINSQLFL